MPFKDEDGDLVEKGNEVVVTRTVSVSSASTTVSIPGLISVTDVLGARTNSQGQVDDGNDEAVEADAGSGSNEVDVTFWTPDGAGALQNAAPGAARDVEIVVEGY